MNEIIIKLSRSDNSGYSESAVNGKYGITITGDGDDFVKLLSSVTKSIEVFKESVIEDASNEEVETILNEGVLATGALGTWAGKTFLLGKKWRNEDRFDLIGFDGETFGSEAADRLRRATPTEASAYGFHIKRRNLNEED